MVQDFFGSENPFTWEDKFWNIDQNIEVPSTNVLEDEQNFKLEIAAPGFEKGDFKIDIDEGVLTISAEKEHSSDETNDKYRKKEFSYSSISRSFRLPETVEQERIDAKYDNGILKVNLPKKEPSAPKNTKRIEIS
ncbi:Hsp20/alpha crystallin family protein [Litoribacter ruber]|uniref:Hsp20/alpha crystallin family protein n=2 Tax=Litoribacter ruber TaxID=702568 RepID=A0AAP2CIY7_9BACT|nr:Hsp20/alpha crystallin family protein [Litoribacter alkaliphilus]MBT0810281.1 Hsp20/alpha crystallin family protein [Litoribacter ruber]